MNKKAVIIIIVIVVVILLAISSWLVYKKFIKKSEDEGTDGDYNLPPINYPGGAPSGGYTTPISFPIKRGMNGDSVIQIQNAINKKCNAGLTPDGAFGPKTESALSSCYKTTSVTEALLTQMKFDAGAGASGCPGGYYKGPLGCMKIGGTSTPTPTGFKPGDNVYARMLGNLLLYKYPSSNSLIGEIAIGSSPKCGTANIIYVCNWIPIGTYISASSEGFSKIRVQAKHINNENSMGYTTKNEEFYVYTTSIIRK